MGQRHYKYIITSTPYDEKWGGVMVLHKMCDLLNSLGENAVMCPIDNSYQYAVNCDSVINTLFYRLRHPIETLKKFRRFYITYRQFKTNSKWNTPVLSPFRMLYNFGLDDYIVVYAEVVDSNPLGAYNVVRYLMHNPGHFTGRTNYGKNELFFRYSNSFARKYTPPQGSVISNSLITISTTPTCFSTNGISDHREGIAYCIRKGRGKPMVHDMDNAILIDGMPLEEVAAIFKRVKMFVSYDPITAFSSFALLCHCPSVIILGDDETPETYRPDPQNNSMYAYSLDEVGKKDWNAIYNCAGNRKALQDEHSVIATKAFIVESQQFFQDIRK